MKNEKKFLPVLMVSLALGLFASCVSTGEDKPLNNETGGSTMNKPMKGSKKIAEVVVSGYETIENTVVNGYQAIENGVVKTYKKIEDKFVDTFLTPDNVAD